MDSFWLKIGILGAICIGLVMVVKHYAGKIELVPNQGDVHDAAQERNKRLSAEPVAVTSEEQEPNAAKQANETAAATEPNQTATTAAETPPAQEQETGPVFRKLSEEEQMEAETLFNNALAFNNIGRLPVTGYKTMVDTCRQIIQKFPGSEYAWKAKRMLKDMPERYRDLYHITPEEIDLGNFK